MRSLTTVDSPGYESVPSSRLCFDSEQIQPTHVAFVIDDGAFDAILRRLQSHAVAYGSQPTDPTNGRIDHPLSERGLFFQTPDAHVFELMTSNSGEA
ncbi:MAG: hypothetical protein WAU75_02470 [Solirubrobacteraceae bacterium]